MPTLAVAEAEWWASMNILLQHRLEDPVHRSCSTCWSTARLKGKAAVGCSSSSLLFDLCTPSYDRDRLWQTLAVKTTN